MNFADVPAQLHPGPGIVGFFGSALGVALPASPSQAATADRLMADVSEAAAGSDQPGWGVAGRVGELMGATPTHDLPSFAVVAPTPNGLAVLINGALDCEIHQSGLPPVTLSGRDAIQWGDQEITGTLERIVIHASGATPPAPTLSPPVPHGSVMGSGATMWFVLPPAAPMAPAPPAPADGPPLPPPGTPPPAPPGPAPAPPPVATPPPPPAVPAPPPGPPAGATPPAPPAAAPVAPAPVGPGGTPPPPPQPPPPLGAPPPAPGPPTAPDTPAAAPSPPPAAAPAAPAPPPAAPPAPAAPAAAPAADGPSILAPGRPAPPPIPPVTPPPPGRPEVVGVLVSDDGTAIELDGNYILGREPLEHPDIRNGVARPYVFADTETAVSRTHARITVDGANVRIEDLGSVNGTHIFGPGMTEWHRIERNKPTAIKAGDRILMGQRVFLFEPPA